MVFNPFVAGASNFFNQTKVFFDMQREFLKTASHLLPINIQTSEMTILHPDPVDAGEWQRDVFKAPDNDSHQFVDELEYYTFIPEPTAERPQSKHLALLVMLHGCEQNASVFAQGSQMNLYAQLYEFVVLYPQHII